jgi:hypothetical protein
MRIGAVCIALVAVSIPAAVVQESRAAPVASEEAGQARITIFARPTVIGWAQSATLFGAARGATPQDTVTIEVKDCGSTFFTTFVEAHVGAGGGWSTPVGTGITSTFRAVWRDATSAAVTIRQAANVSLTRSRSGSGFVVAVIANRSFWRKRVQIQQRRRGAWRTIRTVVLTDSVSSTGTVSASEARFRLDVPKGTQLRALLPLAQARPCYVQSVSKTVRA